MKLIGAGEYNINAIKEIIVTDSYLGLDQSIKRCQNEESLSQCSTKHYIDTVLKQCGCLPFTLSNKVEVMFNS